MKLFCKYLLILLFVGIPLCIQPAFAAQDDPFVPWNFSKSSESAGRVSAEGDSRTGRIMAGAMGLYRKYISAVDADRCTMYPNCSAYSAQAFRKHGAVIGAMMTADRLIHEWDESGLAPKVNIDGQVLNYDPVSNNDFWWHRGSGDGFDK